MKILFTTLITAFSVLVFAQQTNNVVNSSGIPTTVDFNKVSSTVSGKVLNYSDIQGTPYMHTDYKKAIVGDFTNVIPARYNAYTDEVEVKLNEKVQSLPKEKAYSHIRFSETNEKLIYIVDEDQKGYYYILSEGNVSLLRRNVIKFIDEQPAQSSYATTQPAKFQHLKPIYFLYKDFKLIPVKKESDLLKSFPNKDIKTILKENKIKLDKEEDLIKLAQILS